MFFHAVKNEPIEFLIFRNWQVRIIERGKKMKDFLRKTLLLVFVLSMILTLVACNEEPVNPSNTDEESDTVNNTTDETEEIEVTDDLDPSLNFGGREVNFLSWRTGYNSDFYVAVDTGDTISDAVYYRNLEVEERLGCLLNVQFIEGDNSHQQEFNTTVLAQASTGKTDFDIISSYSMCAGTLSTYGIFQDLKTVEHINTTKPYWSESVIEGSTLNNKLYFVTGDMANTFIYNLYFIVVNNGIVEDHGLKDPRDFVLDGTWTLETMMQMTKDCYVDSDEVPDISEGDTYGFVLSGHAYYDMLQAAADIPMAERGEDGIYRLTSDFLGDRMITYVNKLNDFIYDNKDARIDYTYGDMTIANGRALFGTAQVNLLPFMKDNEIDYCVVPFPMIDDVQTSYSTNLGFAYSNFSVLTNADDAAVSGAVLECMASESHHTSAKVFYETYVKTRYSKDAKDSKMFEIIKDNAYIDVCRLYVGCMDWSISPTALFRQSLLERRSWGAKIDSNVGYINGILLNLSEAIE